MQCLQLSLEQILLLASYINSQAPCQYYNCNNLTLFPSQENYIECLLANFFDPSYCSNYFLQQPPNNIVQYICQNGEPVDCYTAITLSETAYLSELFVESEIITSEISEIVSESEVVSSELSEVSENTSEYSELISESEILQSEYNVLVSESEIISEEIVQYCGVIKSTILNIANNLGSEVYVSELLNSELCFEFNSGCTLVLSLLMSVYVNFCKG